ncbi:hypothetical protein B484DRAFT_472212, partial [Ochromonadaceae sp. CCMP2298]
MQRFVEKKRKQKQKQDAGATAANQTYETSSSRKQIGRSRRDTSELDSDAFVDDTYAQHLAQSQSPAPSMGDEPGCETFSRDDSIALLSVAVLMVCYPHSTSVDYSQAYNAQELSDRVNDVFGYSLDMYVDPDYLGHGLNRHLGWACTRSQRGEDCPGPIGKLSGKTRGYVVILTGPDTTQYKLADTNKHDANHQLRRVAYAAAALFNWLAAPKALLAPTLSALIPQPPVIPHMLYAHLRPGGDGGPVSSDLPPSGDGGPAAGSEVDFGGFDLFAEVINLRQGVLWKAGQPSMKRHRSGFAPTEPAAFDALSRSAFDGISRAAGTADYAQQGVPPLDDRMRRVKTAMPVLLQTVFLAMLSQSHAEESSASWTRVQRYDSSLPAEGWIESQQSAERTSVRFEERASAVMRGAVEVCEIIAGIHSGGSLVTPSAVSTGLSLYLGGTDRRWMEVESKRGMSCSYGSAAKICQGWVARRQMDLALLEDSCKGRVDLLMWGIFDNYAVQQFQKNKHTDVPFTISTPTVAGLLCQVAKPPPPLPINGARVSAASQQFDFPATIALLCGVGIVLSEEQAAMRDVNPYQGLRMFHVLRSLPAKSSSYADTEKFLIRQTLECFLHCDQVGTEVAVLLDTEFILTFYRFIYLYPARMRNIFVLPPIFHGRAHVLKNICNDPV